MTASSSPNPLTTAAAAFEQELARYEKVSLELKRTKVTSQKTLHRTQRLLGESVESEEELGVRLQALLEAMNGARQRQQTSMEMALAAAQELQTRAGMFTELLARVSALGQRARDAGGPVAQIVAEKASGGSADHILALLHEVSAQMSEIVGEANAIEQAATADEWPEIAKEVRSLRQQVQSAHAKVLSTCSDVGAHASS